MKSQRNEVGLIRNGEIKEATLVSVANALNNIADNLIPTKPTTLVDLYDNQTKSYDRLLSVKNDEVVGSKGVAKQLKDLRFNTDQDKRVGEGIGYLQEGYGRGQRVVVRLANELMMKAFVQGQRNFSGFAQLSISDLTPQFGAETATKLVDLALREGFERMKRAGMTWQEKDPRFT
jgi:putative component of toxin-antitoxin plasmid stabilization module